MKKNQTTKSQTDWERVRALKDEDIDFSDIPPATEEFWKGGFVRKGMKPRPTREQEMIPVDKDIIAYFKSRYWNYPSEINRVLRDFMNSEIAKTDR